MYKHFKSRKEAKEWLDEPVDSGPAYNGKPLKYEPTNLEKYNEALELTEGDDPLIDIENRECETRNKKENKNATPFKS